MTTSVAVKERPINRSAEQVKAILRGATQFRQVMKPQDSIHGPCEDGSLWWIPPGMQGDPDPNCPAIPAVSRCPYGAIGERLWVRESLYIDDIHYLDGRLPAEKPDAIDEQIYYRADGECCEQIPECACAEVGKPKWRRPGGMPRWASRLTLEITGVRVERLQKISDKDAIAEGIEVVCEKGRMGVPLYRNYGCAEIPDRSATYSYRTLWGSINGPDSWEANPWVWVVSFQKVTP